jgi:hypothetical protein
MSRAPSAAPAPRARERGAWALAALAAWAVLVPWLADAVGLDLGVSTRLEVIDHAAPGVVALAAAALLSHPVSAAPDAAGRLAAGAIAVLAGLWITTTHVALLGDAIDGAEPWGASVLHLSAGPPVLALGVWLLLRSPAR